MKILLLNILGLMLTINLFGQIQNVRFTYDISNSGTQVNYYAHTTNGTANLAGFNFGFFYNDPEASAPVLDVSPATNLLWNTSGNFTQGTTSGSYSADGNSYNRFLEMQLIDGNFVGTNITTTPVLLATITFNIATGGAPLSGGLVTIAQNSNSAAAAFTIYDAAFNFGDVIATGTLSQVLPIKLKQFTVNKFGNERASDINWSSSSEINSAYFDIERSIDGYTFNAIGNVLAAGNSTTEQFYSMIDRNLPTSRGSQDVFYYRLKMVDLDGKFEYSDVRSVRFDNDSEVEFNTYPNPTAGKVYVKMSTPDTD